MCIRDRTCTTITELSKAIGKEPVEVNEAPGFVVNKILVPMINEAVDLLSVSYTHLDVYKRQAVGRG